MGRDTKQLTPFRQNAVQLATGGLIGIAVGVAGYFAATTMIHEGNQEDSGNTSITNNRTKLDSNINTKNVSVGSGESTNLNIRAFVEQLNSWNSEELERALEQATSTPDASNSVSMNTLLLGELAHINPQHALDSVWNFPSVYWNDLLPIVFQEWSVLNLNEAVQAASNLVGTLQEVAMRAILGEQQDLSYPSLLNLTRKLGVYELTQRLIRESEAIELLDRPAEAWDLMVTSNSLTDEYWNVLGEIVNAWKQTEGIAVLDQLHEDLYHRNIATFTHLLRTVAEDEPQQAFDWVVGTSAGVQGETAATILEPWVRLDPASAMQATSRLASRGNRFWTRHVITSVWAEKNPRELIQHIALLPKKNRSIAVSSALVNLVQLDPEEALESLEQLRSVPSAVDQDAEIDLIRSWSQKDPVAAIEWVKTNKDKSSSQYRYMTRDIARAYALIDPDKALAFASGEAPNSFLSGSFLETEVIDSLASRGQVDVAIQLLNQVRDPAQPEVVRVVAENLIRVNRIEDVLELAQRLTEDQQVDYFKSITFSWMIDNPTSLVDNLSNIPSGRVREELVLELLVLSDRFEDYLTATQIETVREYLNDESAMDSSN